MIFDEIIRLAIERGATDLHLEPNSQVTFRVRGELQRSQNTISPSSTQRIAQDLAGENGWVQFIENGSLDCTRNVLGIVCRINLMKTDNGVGLAIRLLSGQSNTIRSCNLNPTLAELLQNEAGLILITGATGSGKTTTLSAFVEEINQTQQKHILTLENPIEYKFIAKKSLIRQRQIGVHTPSIETGLLDALREDPDVIVVGEMREPETMRLTLNAAETGHLVIATMHSASAAEALSRIVMSFPAERQSYILSQLAESFIAVISQNLIYRPSEKLVVPVCEILMASHAVKNIIRKGELSKLITFLQTGASDGMWTFERYQAWLDTKKDWQYPPPPTLSAQESNPSMVTFNFDESELGITSKFSSSKNYNANIQNTTASATQQKPMNISTSTTNKAKDTFNGQKNPTHYSSTSIVQRKVETATKAKVTNAKLSRKRRDPITGLIVDEEGRFEIPAIEHDFDDLARQLQNQSDED